MTNPVCSDLGFSTRTSFCIFWGEHMILEKALYLCHVNDFAKYTYDQLKGQRASLFSFISTTHRMSCNVTSLKVKNFLPFFEARTSVILQNIHTKLNADAELLNHIYKSTETNSLWTGQSLQLRTFCDFKWFHSEMQYKSHDSKIR